MYGVVSRLDLVILGEGKSSQRSTESLTARTLSSSPRPSVDDYCESPSCYFHETLVQLECTQHQDSAKARPTDLESTVVWGFGPMWQT